MTDDRKPLPPPGPWPGMFDHLQPPRSPGAPVLPYKTMRPKRRRVGQLNDGEWLPGYGPDAKSGAKNRKKPKR